MALRRLRRTGNNLAFLMGFRANASEKSFIFWKFPDNRPDPPLEKKSSLSSAAAAGICLWPIQTGFRGSVSQVNFRRHGTPARSADQNLGERNPGQEDPRQLGRGDRELKGFGRQYLVCSPTSF